MCKRTLKAWRLGSIGSFVAAALLTTTPVFAAPFSNGSFEDPSPGVTAPTNGGGQRLPAGDMSIASWTVFAANNRDDIAWLSNDNQFGITTPYGSRFLDLTGYGSSPADGIRQTFDTVVGQAYDVSFYLGFNNSIDDRRGPVSVEVTAAGMSGTFTSAIAGGGPMFLRSDFVFVANSTSTDLSFRGTDAPGDFIGLDNVAVTPTVLGTPGPIAGLGLVPLLGLASVYLFGRKRLPA